MVMRGLLPLLGGIILFGAFIYALKIYAAEDWLTDDDGNGVTIFGIGAVAVVGVGALLIGAILMLVQRAAVPQYFRNVTLPRQSHDLILVPAAGENDGVTAHVGLPDSGVMPTVIAPDLSNLPEGAGVFDPTTGHVLTAGEIDDIIDEHEHGADDPNPSGHRHGPDHGHTHDA
jgi:hypothetical protein